MEIRLDTILTSEDIDAMSMQFHFEVSQKERILYLYKSIENLIEPVVYLGTVFEKDLNNEDEEHLVMVDYLKRTGIRYNAAIGAVLSLGFALDDMIELYLKYEQVSDAYILDCIGLKLLSNMYSQLGVVLVENFGKNLGDIIFVDDSITMEFADKFIEETAAKDIDITDTLMLKPLKSVMCFLILDDERKGCAGQGRDVNICSSCKNVDCQFRRKDEAKKTSKSSQEVTYDRSRAMNYGFERIFGKK